MKRYNGFVFFVDLLGFSSLTKGELNQYLVDDDYSVRNIQPSQKTSQCNNELAAAILNNFREALVKLRHTVKDIQIAQLSDCAFIWSDNGFNFLKAVHFFMKYSLFNKQILCRGGISYGEIIEDGKESYLGTFIVGEAVTLAVKNEGKLKGPRVTMDQNFVNAFWNVIPKNVCMYLYSSEIFVPIHSLINGDTVDEYRWYVFDYQTAFVTNNIDDDIKKRLTRDRLKLAWSLCLHPGFRWNTYTKEGKNQVEMGAEILSDTEILGISHKFKINSVYGKRSIQSMRNVFKEINKSVK